MIIKSLSRRSGGTAQLFSYLFRYMMDKEKSKADAASDRATQFTLRHNVRARTVQGYAKEFMRNEAGRLHQRKDSVHVYHTILSFSSHDRELVDDGLLADIARRYIELRGKDNLYVFTAHRDKDHVHLHCAMGGTRLDGLASRVSRQEFAGIKLAMDAYQKERYPELSHSLPQHGKTKALEARDDFKNKKIAERFKDRTSLLEVLDGAFSISASREQFYSELRKLGHEPYERSGKTVGLKCEGERKFRLNRLGYDEDKLAELDKREKEATQLKEMHDLRSGIGRMPQMEEQAKETQEVAENKDLSDLSQLREQANQRQDIEERDNGREIRGEN